MTNNAKISDQHLFGKVERYDQFDNLATYFELHSVDGNQSESQNKIAAIHNDTFITYNNLNTNANIVARNFTKSIGRIETTGDVLVGILLDEGFERLVTILACLKLGLVIVPLSTDINVESIKSLIRHCHLKILIHKDYTNINVIVADINIKIFVIDEFLNYSIITDSSNLLPSEQIIPHGRKNSAIVLSTSGSSGTPKVIVLTNSQLFNRLFWQWRHIPFKRHEVVCHRTGFMFVDNIVECLSCLLSSVTMVIVSPVVSCDIIKLSGLIQRYSVTWILTVPCLLQKWANQINENHGISESLHSLSTVVSSGEILYPNLARKFFSLFGTSKCRLINLYGSTEVCGDVSCHVFLNSEDVDKFTNNEFLSVGFPVSNNQIYLNADSEHEGEVLVIGENVSPTCGLGFQTGDLGFIHSNHLYICGRVDDMVKINGKKVFTKDISSEVMRHSDVDNCFTVQLTADGKCHMVSFFTVKNKSLNESQIKVEITNNFMRKSCGIYLPILECIDTIPMQSQSMKPDKKTLCSMASNIICKEMEMRTQHKYQKHPSKFQPDFIFLNLPDNSLQLNSVKECIYEVLANHLGVYLEELNDSSNFYEMGGDSLTIVICIADLNRKGLNCTTEAFFSNHSIGDIVNCIIEQSMSTPVKIPEMKYDIIKDFFIDDIDYENKDEVIEFLLENFYTKELVVRYLNTSVTEFVNIVSEIFDLAIQSGCSFSIKNAISKRIVAIQLSEDSSYDFSDANSYFQIDSENALKCFLQFCKPRMADYLPTSKLNVAIVALCRALKKSDVIQLLYFMEQHTVELAKSKNFKTIETINTSEATKKICSELDYQIIKSSSLTSFLTEYRPQSLHSFNISDVYGHFMILDL